MLWQIALVCALTRATDDAPPPQPWPYAATILCGTVAVVFTLNGKAVVESAGYMKAL